MTDDRILDTIYSASIDTARWQAMLGDMAALLNAEFAVSCRGFDEDGVPRDRLVGGTVTSAQADSAFAALREGCATGRRDGLAFVSLPAHGPGDYSFLVGTTAGDLSENTRRRLIDYGDHLRRVGRLRTEIEVATKRARDALALLDMLHVPVMLVDERLRVVVANGAVRKLEKEGVLRLSGRELRFSSAPAMERVRKAVTGIANGAAAGADLLVRLDLSGGASLLAMIEPLEGVFMDTGSAPSSAVAAILIKNPDRAILPTEAALRELHGMPPAEARLAAAMAEGLTIREYSEREGLSETYIRDLSKQVMGRLGVNRQPDLVRAILSLASDFAHRDRPLTKTSA